MQKIMLTWKGFRLASQLPKNTVPKQSLLFLNWVPALWWDHPFDSIPDSGSSRLEQQMSHGSFSAQGSW